MIQALAIKLLFKTVSKVVERIDDNKIAKSHDKRIKDVEQEVILLRSASHPPIFTSDDRTAIHKRLDKLERDAKKSK